MFEDEKIFEMSISKTLFPYPINVMKDDFFVNRKSWLMRKWLENKHENFVMDFNGKSSWKIKRKNFLMRIIINYKMKKNY